MNKPYPIRPASHNLEEASERFFANSLPPNWVAEKPRNDYGVDLRVDIFDGEDATGLELLVQLKASTRASGRETETVGLRVSTYNYLRGKLQVVMLVKYVLTEGEAYWLLLKDIPEPNQTQATFTVRVPKSNKLSSINWKDVHRYVQGVTNEKLAAVRARRLRNRRDAMNAAGKARR